MDYMLQDYKLTNCQLAISPLFNIIALRHISEIKNQTTWQGKSIHLIIGVIEFIPFIGVIISMGETYFASRKQLSLSLVSNTVKKIEPEPIIPVILKNETIISNNLSFQNENASKSIAKILKVEKPKFQDKIQVECGLDFDEKFLIAGLALTALGRYLSGISSLSDHKVLFMNGSTLIGVFTLSNYVGLKAMSIAINLYKRIEGFTRS